MEVKIKDSFFESYKRMINGISWPEKVYDFFRYDIPRFVSNFWRFKKELWKFRNWDHTYNLMIFRRSLELTADCIEFHGMEVEESRMKKVAKMRRAIELIKHIEDGDYIEQAEKELGLKTNCRLNFVQCADNSDLYEMVDDASEEEESNNSKIFKRSDEIENEQRDELWSILKGQGQFPGSDEEWDKWYDGSGMAGWWD